MKILTNPLILFFLSITLMLSCEDAQITAKEYPYAVMKEVVTSISGAKFIANVSSIGNQPILSHGFVWGTQSSPNIEIDEHKYIETELSTGNMALEINSGLIDGQTYYVRPFIKTERFLVYGSELSFISEGSNSPEIHNFQPEYGSVGTTIEVTGVNFGFSRNSNIVKFGQYTAEVDSVTATKLYVKVPQVMEPGEVYITVKTAGMSVNSINKFDLYFPWQKLEGTYNLNYASTSFVIDDNAYVINANTSSGVIFNSNKTVQSFNLPENAGSDPKAFSISNKGYVLLKNGFYEYDPMSRTWIQKADFPDNITERRYAFTMSFDQMGLIGFCYNSQKLWSYNPNNNSWTERASFPEDFTQTTYPVWGTFSFSIGNKGYLGVSQSVSVVDTFWEYDPDSNVWSEKSPLPTNAYDSYACMVIEGKAYVGLGKNHEWNDGYVSNLIWQYDQVNDRWNQFQNCPTKMAVNTSFGIGNKGYVLSRSGEYSTLLNEIWEFNPSEN